MSVKTNVKYSSGSFFWRHFITACIMIIELFTFIKCVMEDIIKKNYFMYITSMFHEK